MVSRSSAKSKNRRGRVTFHKNEPNSKRIHSLPRKGDHHKKSLFTKDQLSDLIHQRRVEKVFENLKPTGK